MRNGIAFLVIFCSGCGIFRNTTKTKEEQESSFSSDSDVNMLSQHSHELKSNMLTFRSDSAGHDYMVQLWPLGNFTYSPISGFQENAERIEITGRLRHSSSSAGMMESAKKSTDKLEAQEKQKLQIKDQNAKSGTATSPSWKWILICLAVLVAVMVIWKIRKKMI